MDAGGTWLPTGWAATREGLRLGCFREARRYWPEMRPGIMGSERLSSGSLEGGGFRGGMEWRMGRKGGKKSLNEGVGGHGSEEPVSSGI